MTLPNHLEINGDRYARIDSEVLAHVFANWNGNQQAKFLNELGRVASKWPGDYGHGKTQWCSMAEDLTADGRAVLASMGQFVAETV